MKDFIYFSYLVIVTKRNIIVELKRQQSFISVIVCFEEQLQFSFVEFNAKDRIAENSSTGWPEKSLFKGLFT